MSEVPQLKDRSIPEGWAAGFARHGAADQLHVCPLQWSLADNEGRAPGSGREL